MSAGHDDDRDDSEDLQLEEIPVDNGTNGHGHRPVAPRLLLDPEVQAHLLEGFGAKQVVQGRELDRLCDEVHEIHQGETDWQLATTSAIAGATAAAQRAEEIAKLAEKSATNAYAAATRTHRAMMVFGVLPTLRSYALGAIGAVIGIVGTGAAKAIFDVIKAHVFKQ